jgi:small conductance mechanosensitive channel
LISVTLAAAQVDPRTEACGNPDHRRWLCQLAYDHSSSHALARAAHYASPWVTALLIILGAWIINRILRVVVRHIASRAVKLRPGSSLASRPQRVDTISAALGSVVTIIVVIVTTFAVLNAFGVNLAPILAGAGLLGVILGFGAQNMLRDLIAGGFMVSEDQFSVGDEIDTGVVTGTVESLTLRVTRVRDDQGVIWHVPNGTIVRVANMSQRDDAAIAESAEEAAP